MYLFWFWSFYNSHNFAKMEKWVWPVVNTRIVPHFLLTLYKSCIILLKYFLPKFQIHFSSTSMGISGNYYNGYYEDHMLITWLILWKSPPSLQFSRHHFVPFFQSMYLHWQQKAFRCWAAQACKPCSALLGIHPCSLRGSRNKGGWVFLIRLPTDKADPWFLEVEILALPSEFRLCWLASQGKVMYWQPKGGYWNCQWPPLKDKLLQRGTSAICTVCITSLYRVWACYCL